MIMNLGAGGRPGFGLVNVDRDGNRGGIVADGIRLPLSSRQADAILASHILEHIHDLAAVLRECHRVLTLGGFLHVRVPYQENPIRNPFHVRAFYKIGVRQIVAGEDGGGSSGWRLVAMERIGRELAFTLEAQ